MYEEFVDYNDPDRQKYQGTQYWKSLWDTIEEYMTELKPKDVKEYGISKQTLWNVKQKVSYDVLSEISKEVKNRFIIFFEHL